MNVRITSDDRELILRIMCEELGDDYTCSGIPDFTCSVNGIALLRNGCIEFSEEDPQAVKLIGQLSKLSLCEEIMPADPPPSSGDQDGKESWIRMEFSYPIDRFDPVSLLNLFCILSARQKLINQAIDARNAFRISRELMENLLSHPPVNFTGFNRALYGRDDEYSGIGIGDDSIELSGFLKGHAEEAHIRRQLADMIVEHAVSKKWVKAFTPNVRNRKYAFRTWLNAIGMRGPEYEEARRIMLARLPGRTDQRKIPAHRYAGGQP